jgi:hypothetical protein
MLMRGILSKIGVYEYDRLDKRRTSDQKGNCKNFFLIYQIVLFFQSRAELDKKKTIIIRGSYYRKIYLHFDTQYNIYVAVA